MDFSVLGPLRCTVGADDVTPKRRRECMLLSALLVAPGESISAEALAAAVWRDAPPNAWPKALQMQVLRLRAAIGRSQVETTAYGYRLTAPHASIDAAVFETQMPPLPSTNEYLSADADARVSELLALWRGAPFEELGEWSPAVFAGRRLRELRANALDARAASRQARGVASVAELADLVNDDPLREPRWALLMVGLYRAGRQIEALQTFQRARKTLTVEFGVEPGPELVALERAILDHDARLDAPSFRFGSFDAFASIEFQRRARALFEKGEREAAIGALEDDLAAAREHGGDPRSICEGCIELAEYSRACGDWPRATAAIVDAVRLARVLDDPVLLARAAVVASGEGSVTGMDPAGSPVALLDEALARLPSAPSPLRAHLHARLAVAGTGCRPLAVAAADSDEALRIAAMVADPTTLAAALHSRLVVDQDIAHLEPRRADCMELLRLADAAATPVWRVWALPVLARIESLRGELAAADAHYEELALLGEELHHPVARYHAAFGAVLRTTVRGDFVAALRAIERVRDAGTLALPDPSGAALGYFGSLGVIQLLQGTVPDSSGPVQMSFPQATMDATYRAYHSIASVQRGDLAAAIDALRHVDGDSLAALPRDSYWPSLVWLLAVAFEALADGERAEALYELAVPFEDVVVVDLGATFLGAMSHHLGVLAATFGADATASEHLRAAFDVHRRLGADTWAASSRTALERLPVG